MKINEITNTPVELMHDEDDLNYIKQHAIISKKEPINDSDSFQNLSVPVFDIDIFASKLYVLVKRVNYLLSPNYTEISYNNWAFMQTKPRNTDLKATPTVCYLKWSVECPKHIIMDFVKQYSKLVSMFVPEIIYYSFRDGPMRHYATSIVTRTNYKIASRNSIITDAHMSTIVIKEKLYGYTYY
jgi:hypothetical protein